jgi:SNF2 family DNA or RNA helicase
MKWTDFARRYCGAYLAPFGKLNRKTGKRAKILWADGASNIEELRRFLMNFMFYRKRSDVIDSLPPKIYQVIRLDLPTDKREIDFDKDSIDPYKDAIAFECMAEILKLQGEMKAPLVAEHVIDILEEQGKVIVFAHHIEVIKTLEKILHKFNPAVIYGATKDRDFQRKKFLHDDSCRAFIGQINAAGEGGTFVTDANPDMVSTVVFAETDWVPKNIQQASDRAFTYKKKDSILVQFMTISDSIDDYVLRSVMEKLETIGDVLDGSSKN